MARANSSKSPKIVALRHPDVPENSLNRILKLRPDIKSLDWTEVRNSAYASSKKLFLVPDDWTSDIVEHLDFSTAVESASANRSSERRIDCASVLGLAHELSRQSPERKVTVVCAAPRDAVRHSGLSFLVEDLLSLNENDLSTVLDDHSKDELPGGNYSNWPGRHLQYLTLFQPSNWSSLSLKWYLYGGLFKEFEKWHFGFNSENVLRPLIGRTFGINNIKSHCTLLRVLDFTRRLAPYTLEGRPFEVNFLCCSQELLSKGERFKKIIDLWKENGRSTSQLSLADFDEIRDQAELSQSRSNFIHLDTDTGYFTSVYSCESVVDDSGSDRSFFTRAIRSLRQKTDDLASPVPAWIVRISGLVSSAVYDDSGLRLAYSGLEWKHEPFEEAIERLSVFFKASGKRKGRKIDAVLDLLEFFLSNRMSSIIGFLPNDLPPSHIAPDSNGSRSLMIGGLATTPLRPWIDLGDDFRLVEENAHSNWRTASGPLRTDGAHFLNQDCEVVLMSQQIVAGGGGAAPSGGTGRGAAAKLGRAISEASNGIGFALKCSASGGFKFFPPATSS